MHKSLAPFPPDQNLLFSTDDEDYFPVFSPVFDHICIPLHLPCPRTFPVRGDSGALGSAGRPRETYLYSKQPPLQVVNQCLMLSAGSAGQSNQDKKSSHFGSARPLSAPFIKTLGRSWGRSERRSQQTPRGGLECFTKLSGRSQNQMEEQDNSFE